MGELADTALAQNASGGSLHISIRKHVHLLGNRGDATVPFKHFKGLQVRVVPSDHDPKYVHVLAIWVAKGRSRAG